MIFTPRYSIPVVGGHNRHGLCLPDADFKTLQIDFPQCPGTDGIQGEKAFGLLIVSGKVFDGYAMLPVRLQAHSKIGGGQAGNKRVFRIVFKAPPAQGVPVDIHARTQDDGHMEGFHLLGKGGADLLLHLFVPGLSDHYANRERTGGTADDVHSGRTVKKLCGRDSQAGLILSGGAAGRLRQAQLFQLLPGTTGNRVRGFLQGSGADSCQNLTGDEFLHGHLAAFYIVQSGRRTVAYAADFLRAVIGGFIGIVIHSGEIHRPLRHQRGDGFGDSAHIVHRYTVGSAEGQ